MTRKAFGELHSRYRVRLLCSMIAFTKDRDMAEDVVAVAFRKAFQNRDRFRGESSFYTWLYTIAMNEARESLKQLKAKRFISLDAPGAPEVPHPSLLDQVLVRDECCRKIRAVLRQIPSKYRRVLTDYFVRGRSTRQLAWNYRIPEGTVLSRLFNAKKLLREAWEA